MLGSRRGWGHIARLDLDSCWRRYATAGRERTYEKWYDSAPFYAHMITKLLLDNWISGLPTARMRLADDVSCAREECEKEACLVLGLCRTRAVGA